MRRLHTLSIYIGMLCLMMGLLGLPLLTSCQDNLYYTLYQDLPEHQWDSNDTLYFSIPPTEHDLDVAVTFSVRTSPSFRYQDIVARAELLDGNAVVSSLPINITLYGNNEESAHDGVLQNESYSKPQALHMQANHNYILRVTHLMRLNPLDEVNSVGVIVER